MKETKLPPYRNEQELKHAVSLIVSGYPGVHTVIDGFGSTLFRVKEKSFIRIAGDEKLGFYLCFKASPECSGL